MPEERNNMITRDNAASISGTAQNARQRLGELIAHYMDERNMSDQRVSRTCSASPAEVEAWRAGKAVPSPDQWSKLKRSVHHAFGRFAEVYQRARTEDDNEARERARANMNKEQPKMTATTKINSMLGDKIAAAIAEPTPKLEIVKEQDKPPANEQTRVVGSRANKPAGSYSAESVNRRRSFVRELLVSRPKIRTSGADSVVEAVRKAFGIGISPESVEEIRAELDRERLKSEILRDMPPPSPPTLPAMAAQLAEHVKPRESASDLETAVQLILEALPNLQAFSITVDEHGEAHVDYQIRRVTVTTEGGSLKVRR